MQANPPINSISQHYHILSMSKRLDDYALCRGLIKAKLHPGNAVLLDTWRKRLNRGFAFWTSTFLSLFEPSNDRVTSIHWADHYSFFAATYLKHLERRLKHDAKLFYDYGWMETQRRLQTNRDALLEQYFANLEDVYNLQDTLIQSVLPSVTDELGLGLEAQEWAKEWLSDTRT